MQWAVILIQSSNYFSRIYTYTHPHSIMDQHMPKPSSWVWVPLMLGMQWFLPSAAEIFPGAFSTNHARWVAFTRSTENWNNLSYTCSAYHDLSTNTGVAMWSYPTFCGAEPAATLAPISTRPSSSEPAVKHLNLLFLKDYVRIRN